MSSIKILANDGLAPSAVTYLEEKGFTILTEFVEQEKLASFINDQGISGLIVRSATKVRKAFLEECPKLQIIGRAGVGMDNIDVKEARSMGKTVVNTPKASSRSVAELAIGGIFSSARHLSSAAQQMPNQGNSEFKKLKKQYSKGIELQGKTLGIVGLGNIGSITAEYGIRLGMKIIAYSRTPKKIGISIRVGSVKVEVPVETTYLSTVLQESDFVVLHVPFTGQALIGKAQFKLMKPSSALINVSRGGVVDENELISALNSGEISSAFMDVFENEPTPKNEILKHKKIMSTPHIGGSTIEAQERIGMEISETFSTFFEKS